MGDLRKNGRLKRNPLRNYSLTLLVLIVCHATIGCQQSSGRRMEAVPSLGTGFSPANVDMLRATPEDLSLFVEKCSACHHVERALVVIKDPEVWALTIKRMQTYSKGSISDTEAQKLVDFHVARQQKELNSFKDTCTRCHDDERISRRSMTEEQWLETIKRMQQKAPGMISDEKVNLLAAYFHRRELTLARIFYGKCRLCHLDISIGTTLPDPTKQLDGLIALAYEEFGKSMQITDVNSLLSAHAERQKRDMLLFNGKCNTCHYDESRKSEKADLEKMPIRTRAEWISFIANLQGVELSKETQNAINSQIDIHLSRFKHGLSPNTNE